MTSKPRRLNSTRRGDSRHERHQPSTQEQSQIQHSIGGNSESDEEGCDEEDESNEAEAEAEACPENFNQTVKNLVRYALACEYQRISIKRSGITEKVIGKQRCNYKLIFREAQEQLRNKFGMEMVELPARQKLTIREKKAAQKVKGNSKSSQTYILKTILPPEYRNPEIMPPSATRSSSDEAAYMGLYTVIICLISLSADGQMANHQLHKYLKRLNLDRNTGLGTTSELLARMKKENYLQEYKSQDEEGQTSEWRVGARGLVEIDREAIVGFVHKIFGESAPEDLLSKLNRSLGIDVSKT